MPRKISKCVHILHAQTVADSLALSPLQCTCAGVRVWSTVVDISRSLTSLDSLSLWAIVSQLIALNNQVWLY